MSRPHPPSSHRRSTFPPVAFRSLLRLFAPADRFEDIAGDMQTLFARSLLSAQNADVGFQSRNRMLVTVNPADIGYSDQQGHAFIKQMLERIGALLIVTALASVVPALRAGRVDPIKALRAE